MSRQHQKRKVGGGEDGVKKMAKDPVHGAGKKLTRDNHGKVFFKKKVTKLKVAGKRIGGPLEKNAKRKRSGTLLKHR